MIRIISWLWRQPEGRTSYTAEHVNIFADMVRRHCSIPFSLACVTDMPSGIDPSVDIIPLPTDFAGISPVWGPRKPNCYRRLALYRRDAADIFGGERIASFDLDCVIGRDLAPLLSRKEDLVLFKGTAPGRPYNGSLQLLTAGCRPQVYENFSAEGALESGTAFHGSDQAWLAHCLGPSEATWDERDGVYFYGRHWTSLRDTVVPRILFYPGKLKPWTARLIDPFTRRNYRLKMKEAA